MCSRTTAWPRLVYRRCVQLGNQSSRNTYALLRTTIKLRVQVWVCEMFVYLQTCRMVDRDRESTVYCAVYTRTAQKASVQLVLLDRVLWTLTIRLGSSGQRISCELRNYVPASPLQLEYIHYRLFCALLRSNPEVESSRWREKQENENDAT
uniref:Uncharacterized protein n=1 Tax=Trichogramma kaykai TaxID=54128 RepID=A0ABD2VUQ1_9HYME